MKRRKKEEHLLILLDSDSRKGELISSPFGREVTEDSSKFLIAIKLPVPYGSLYLLSSSGSVN